MIELPPELHPILNTLNAHRITPIIVGGYVRDALLYLHSKDIDIELYNIPSLEVIETLLKPFGKLNLVGKSFGVIKLKTKELDIDFSPPRTESKLTAGHKGFNVRYDFTLDFVTAARRRDFTINAIGYNPQTKTLLDPYGGVDDLHYKRLRCVDETTFIEDPLRPLRAIQFAARFDLTCDPILLNICKKMIALGALEELPKERIFEELKKLLLLSPKPSIGLLLLEKMGGRALFSPSCDEAWSVALDRVDTMAKMRSNESQKKLALLLAALLLDTHDPEALLKRITDHRSLLVSTLTLIRHARTYGTLSFPPKSLLMGRDLIALGLAPSESFKTILDTAYEAQLNQKFFTHEQGLEWLKKYLVTKL